MSRRPVSCSSPRRLARLRRRHGVDHGLPRWCLVPRTVDGQPARTAVAVDGDLALLLLFAVQHSVMARRWVKAWLRRRIPAGLERTTTSSPPTSAWSCCWRCGNPSAAGSGSSRRAAVVLWLLFAAGWLLAIAATFAVDHLELIGLRQAGWAAPAGPDPELQVGGLHAVVRHPLMTGLILAFWATPRMGASHLLFALAATGYVAIGIVRGARLRRTFGAAYDAYAARVPALVPGLPRRRDRARSLTV